MPDYSALENQFQKILDLKQRPVAIAFRDGSAARDGEVLRLRTRRMQLLATGGGGPGFLHRAVGSLQLPDRILHAQYSVARESRKGPALVLETMINLGYLKMEEVPGIPVLPETPKNIVFAPLGDTPVDPDVVLFVAAASKLMLLEEAAIRAGVASKLPLLARPTCMAIPAALAHGMVTSAGCIGNRDLHRYRRWGAVRRDSRACAGVGGAGVADHCVGE